MEQDQQPSRAEQRMLAVAKLKRAASLPRMKDGRRPPMHVEAVSEGEKGQSDDKIEGDVSPPDIALEESLDIEPEVEPGVEEEERATSPSPATRTKRRSRSRSRSRSSKDFKVKSRATQSPTPSPLVAGDSSQDEDPPPPPQLLLPAVTPLMSPIPSHFAELQRSRLLRSPTPTSPEPSVFYPGTSPPTPMLPTLEALQKGLFRSNSAGGSNAGRMMAMHKLTGGTDSYVPSSSPTPPPLPGKLNRNNTVSGGERNAARQFMLSRLGGRITKETDGEQASGGEEITAPSSTAKRRRRRSRRGSQSANTGVSDSEFLSTTSPNTPIVPPTPLPTTFDTLVDLRAQSVTPFQATHPPNQDIDRASESPRPPETASARNIHEHERPEPTRRRSVVVEDEEEERFPPPRMYGGLPTPPPQRFPLAALRGVHASDTPSNGSGDSGSPSGISVPVYMSQRTPPINDPFPSSPYATPLREVQPRDDDDDDEEEERVLYPADTYRPRTPYEDSFDREISWIASPVPELRIPLHDDDVDNDDDDDAEREEQDREQTFEEPPLSARSSNGFSPHENEAYDDTSPRISSDSKSLVVESEPSLEVPPSYIPLSPSVAALSQTTSGDGSISPQTYPARLSVASRSPLDGGFADVWDERIVSADVAVKRNGDLPGAWEKIKSTFSKAGSSSGRRSRTNSIVTRERRDHTDSSISRESGASLTSAKTDKYEPNGTSTQQQTQPLMQTPSASASILSLSPHAPARGGPSPIPPASSADLSKYQNAKLFPFPGMKKLEEQRNRAKGLPASASSPDIIMLSSSNEEDNPPLSAGSYSNTPAQSPETRDRKLSHQASDTRLVAKYNQPHSATSTSHPEYFDITPQSPTQNGGSSKLPMTLPGVKQWLSKNKKIFSSQASTPSTSPPALESPPPLSVTKKASLSDLLRRKENDLGTDWEEINSTPTSTSGDTLLGKRSSTRDSKEPIMGVSTTNPSNGSALARSEHTDTERTPKAKKVMPPSDHNGDVGVPYYDDSPSALPSRPDPFSSATPDPSSSLSDYPAHSTSESSSATSSRDSLGGVGPQGTVVLERLDENLARGSRSPIWSSAIDDPQRKLMLSSPVLQVVNPNTVKDRFLFLFNDLLVIAKPVIPDQETFMDPQKQNPLDRKFVVKSVVLLHQLRFNADRSETQAKAATSPAAPRNPLIRSFIPNFARDPDQAISSLFMKSGAAEDPIALGQLLFRTVDLDRARLGDYLSRRSSKTALKAYLDSFGFLGLRIDRALRVFLHSINIPNKTPHHANGLEYLLDAFAGRWYEANVRIVDYDKDLALRFVRAIVQLNELLHDGIAQEPGPTGYPRRDVSSRDFVDAFRRYDPKYQVSDELLEDVYASIIQERLSQSRNPSSGGPPETAIIIKRAFPARLTYKLQSEPIILRLPQADPNLKIKLYGQDLVFDPPVLSFARSSEASFRVMGTSLGSKTMTMCRSGPNAIKYTGLPLSHTVVVERAFMRYTFQMAFINHNGLKRRYMFSVDDPMIRHQWAVSLRRHVDTATSSLNSESLSASKFQRAAERLAFKVLQETLIGAPPAPAHAIQKALQRINGSAHNGTAHYSPDRTALQSNVGNIQSAAYHIRSKSRSKVYHRHGAGKNELDLSYGAMTNRGARDSEEAEKKDSMLESDHHPRGEGPLWSARDLEMHCQHNSSIASILSYLQGATPELSRHDS